MNASYLVLLFIRINTRFSALIVVITNSAFDLVGDATKLTHQTECCGCIAVNCKLLFVKGGGGGGGGSSLKFWKTRFRDNG